MNLAELSETEWRAMEQRVLDAMRPNGPATLRLVAHRAGMREDLAERVAVRLAKSGALEMRPGGGYAQPLLSLTDAGREQVAA